VRKLRLGNAQPLETMRVGLLVGFVGHVGRLHGSDGLRARHVGHATNTSLRKLRHPTAVAQLHLGVRLEPVGRLGNVRRTGRVPAERDGDEEHRVRQLRHAVANPLVLDQLRLGRVDEHRNLRWPGRVSARRFGKSQHRVRQLRHAVANPLVLDQLRLGRVDQRGKLHRTGYVPGERHGNAEHRLRQLRLAETKPHVLDELRLGRLDRRRQLHGSGRLRRRRERKQRLQLRRNPVALVQFFVRLGPLELVQREQLLGHEAGVLRRGVLQRLRTVRLMEPSAGLQVTESVRLVRQLGEGGMGSVWLADHLTLRTQVAVKFMSWHLSRSGEAAARFSREASAAAQIKSPHVVQIFDHGLLDGQLPYIVMELLEGETLARYVQRHGGRLSFSSTSQIVTQVCKALSRAHAQQVIHRDIKPDNIFVTDSDGEIFVKLLDFGVAKHVSEGAINMTSTGAVVGTPHYMSPEQMLSSKHVDARADLWAVGVVAYQCVTGTVPFDAETFAGVAVRVAEGSFALPHAQQGIGSRALDEWFSRALAREPAARFASARELADALSAAVAGGGAFAHAPAFGDSRAPIVSSSSGGVSASVPGATPAPRTFAGMARTEYGAGGRRRYAVGAVAAFALLAGAAIGVVALTRSSASTPSPEVVTPSAAPPPAAATSDSPPVVAAPSAELAPAVAPSASVAEQAPTVATPPAAPPKRSPPRPRPAASPAREPARAPLPNPAVRDRGF